MAHQTPDRVPWRFGVAHMAVSPLYLSLLEKFNLGEPTAPFRQGHTINYMDDRILDALGTDTRYIWPGASPSSPTHPDGDLIFDDFGQPWRQTYPYYSATDGLLKNSTSLSDIHNKVHWPDVNDPKWTRGVLERAKAIADSGYFIIGRMVVSHGPRNGLRPWNGKFYDRHDDPTRFCNCAA